MDRNRLHLLLRRLHSLAGIVPIGCLSAGPHLPGELLRARRTRKRFNGLVESDCRDSRPPCCWPRRCSFSGCRSSSMAFYGLVILWSADIPNALHYDYTNSYLYVLQRVTGVIALLVYRLPRLHHAADVLLLRHRDHVRLHAQLHGSPLWFAVYVVGVLSAIFHFTNGIWTFCVTWGVTVGARSQRMTAVRQRRVVRGHGRHGRGHSRRLPLERRAVKRQDASRGAAMAEERLIVVGGGLAGLMTTIKIAELGVPVDVFSFVPVKRSPLRVRAGRHQRRGEQEGRRRHAVGALRRHHLRRRLPRQPAAGQGHVRGRTRRSSTCSTAWACRSTAPPRACSISVASAARSTTAPPSPAPPPASNCCTRSTSRCAATRRRAWCASSSTGSSSPR